MALLSENLIFCGPANSTPATQGYGGGPNSTASMTSGILQNEFLNVTDQQRREGDTDYRKQFIWNNNDENWAGVLLWISENTPASGDSVSICGGGVLSKLGEAASIGVATHMTDTVIKVEFSGEGSPTCYGEHVFNASEDSDMASHRKVISVATESVGVYMIEIESAFGVSTTWEFTLSVTPATMFSYAEPSTKDSAIPLGNIHAGEFAGVWKKRIIESGADGYTNNGFSIRLES